MLAAFALLSCISLSFAFCVSERSEQDPLHGLTCGTVRSDDEVQASEAHFKTNRISSKFNLRQATTVNVYFNIIYVDETQDGGYGTDEQISTVMESLNTGFEPLGLSFNLADTIRTQNENWYNGVSPNNTAELEMKSTLRRGGVADLNIYTVGFPDSGYSGYATFPDAYSTKPELDGVLLNFLDLPAADAGKTLVHEVGHWVGLYHTFQGGCTGDGDFVDDTPAEASPAYCARGRDTCPDDEGLDPVDNFMDYAGCRSVWSDGQIARAKDQLATYRGI